MVKMDNYRIMTLIILTFLYTINCESTVELYGFRLETEENDELGRQGKVTEDGRVVVINTGHPVSLRLFGRGFEKGGFLSFTSRNAPFDTDCSLFGKTDTFEIRSSEATNKSALATVNIPISEYGVYHFCIGKPLHTNNETMILKHQGNATWLTLHAEQAVKKTYLMPLWLQIMVILILLSFSGLFSGLNLGLMSLDKTELDIMIASGTENEKRYAKTIRPLRKRGNFLLCTILLGNVMVNNTLAILLDDLTGSGLAAVVSATLAIVIFGEIIPQAFCSRYGLAVGAKTVWFTRFFMLVTFPLSYPISRILDCALGEEIGYVYNRDRLRELLRLTEKEMDLVKDEVNIITGALELSKKTVGHIMTKLEDVFMIPSDAILDFDTMSLIMKTGYTRIPIYEKERSNIVALLNIKDLAFIDPDDRTPLHTVTQFYKHPVNFVFEDTRLNVMLEEFKKGRSHMALVQRVNSEGPGDPFYENLGLVTLEDIIEEIIQSEIVDETDTVTDNRAKNPRKAHVKDFSVFNQPDVHNYPRLSPQLTLATFQFLTTSVVPFKPELISEIILHKLLKQNVVVNLRLTDPTSEEVFIYKSGRQCDYFIIILQGRVQVELGKENLLFEAGPFMYFGTQALIGPSMSALGEKQASQISITSLSELNSFSSNVPLYVPDFTVRAISDLQYIRVRRAHYMVARRATLVERHPKQPTGEDGGGSLGSSGGAAVGTSLDVEDQFDKDWQRVGTSQLNGVIGSGSEQIGSRLDSSDSFNDGGSIKDMLLQSPDAAHRSAPESFRTMMPNASTAIIPASDLKSNPNQHSKDKLAQFASKVVDSGVGSTVTVLVENTTVS